MINVINSSINWIVSVINTIFNINFPLNDSTSITLGGIWIFGFILLFIPTLLSLLRKVHLKNGRNID